MKGFTLVELLVVIGIIVILMTAALVAINPFRQFALANNASRWSGVTTIMNAISQKIVDKKGSVTWDCDDDPLTDDTILTTSNVCMGAGALADVEIGKCDSFYDICGCLVSDADAEFDDYIANMPYDPQTGGYNSCADYNTRYTIQRDSTTNRITIAAVDEQLGETISITR